jgi:hypothetical protein
MFIIDSGLSYPQTEPDVRNLTEIGFGKTRIRMYLFEEPNLEPNSRFHF